jgi:hypothetical protein
MNTHVLDYCVLSSIKTDSFTVCFRTKVTKRHLRGHKWTVFIRNHEHRNWASVFSLYSYYTTIYGVKRTVWFDWGTVKLAKVNNSEIEFYGIDKAIRTISWTINGLQLLVNYTCVSKICTDSLSELPSKSIKCFQKKFVLVSDLWWIEGCILSYLFYEAMKSRILDDIL